MRGTQSVFVSIALYVVSVAAATAITDNVDASTGNKEQQQQATLQSNERERKLDFGTFDFINYDVDECYDETKDSFGKCVEDKFPTCRSDEFRCYNRANRRDKFYSDWNPYYYVNYNRVLCYPKSWEMWGACSSCTPGRWCSPEERCILDETNYCCEGQWGNVCSEP